MSAWKRWSMAVLVSGVAMGAASAAPFEVDCAPVAVRMTDLYSSVDTTESRCGSYGQFTCYSHRLSVVVHFDEAETRPAEVGLRFREPTRDGRGAKEFDALLRRKGAGRYEGVLTFRTDLSSRLHRELVPYVVAPERGAEGRLKRCLLEPRGQGTGYFVVTNGAAPALPVDGAAYGTRIVELEQPRVLVLPSGALPYDDMRTAAYPQVQEAGGRISLFMSVDDGAIRAVASHDGFERPFALLPVLDGTWRRVELAYRGASAPAEPGDPAHDEYAYTVLEEGRLVPADVDLERLRDDGVAFGLEVSDASGQLQSVVWLQDWGKNYRPYPWVW